MPSLYATSIGIIKVEELSTTGALRNGASFLELPEEFKRLQVLLSKREGGVVLLQHEVQIDPSLIDPMRTNENRLSRKHGQITRLIYESLKFAKGKTMTTTQVTICLYTKLTLKAIPKTARA